MFEEFKKFAVRGPVIDLAIGVIIGAAFGKIVSSMVSDVLMPPLGLIVGRIDFSDRFIDLSRRGFATLKEAQDAGAPTLNYGLFLNTVVEFLIVAFVLFLIVRQMNRLRKTEEPAPAEPSKDCPFCLSPMKLGATRCPHCTANLGASA